MTTRKMLSWLLALAVIFSLIPVGTLAEALPDPTQPQLQTEAPTQDPEEQPSEPETTPTEATELPLPEETQGEEILPEQTLPEETFPEETEPQTSPVTEEADGEPVEIFFTVMVEDHILSLEDRELLAAQSLEVPGFDLTPYGLENKTRGTTIAHVLIYATEVCYCGLDAQDAGQGYLAEAGLLDTEVLTLRKIPQQFWGLEGTLLLVVDGELLEQQEDLDCTAMELEETGNILLAALPEDISAVAGSLSWEDGIITAEAGREIFYAPVEEGYALGGDVTNWYSAGITDEVGQLSWEVPGPGTYCLALPGKWEEETFRLTAAVGITVAEEESVPEERPQIQGDVNEDGVLDQTDGACLAGYINGTQTLSEQGLRLADMDHDGRINMLDVALIYRSLWAEQ